MIADLFHRMKYMERRGSSLRKIVREIEKLPGYIAAYNPEISSTATDFRGILKNTNYQLGQKNLVSDQVGEQDKSPDIPHAVLNLCTVSSNLSHALYRLIQSQKIPRWFPNEAFDACRSTKYLLLHIHQIIFAAEISFYCRKNISCIKYP